MKKIYKLLCVLAVTLLCMVSTIYAQEQYDELQVTVISEKEEYAKGEKADATITVTNQSKRFQMWR